MSARLQITISIGLGLGAGDVWCVFLSDWCAPSPACMELRAGRDTICYSIFICLVCLAHPKGLSLNVDRMVLSHLPPFLLVCDAPARWGPNSKLEHLFKPFPPSALHQLISNYLPFSDFVFVLAHNVTLCLIITTLWKRHHTSGEPLYWSLTASIQPSLIYLSYYFS